MRAFIALALLVTVAGCDRQGEVAPQAKPEAAKTEALSGVVDMSHRGAAMPEERFTGPDGKVRRLDEFKGTPVLVNLWATWCGPCVREMPSLDRLAGRAGERLRILTISQDGRGPPDPVAPWWAKAGLRHLQLYRDPETGLGFAYEGGQLPTTVFYDAAGKEQWRISGGLDWEGPKARELLKDVLTVQS